MDSVESAGGQLGAVLSAPRGSAVALGPGGPWLATSLEHARQVLTDPEAFDFPGNVNRTGDLSGSRGDSRSGHTLFTPVGAQHVARGVATFEREWVDALAEHERMRPAEPYDAMLLLRRPVARSTTTAVFPSARDDVRDRVADHVLAWIDALGPVIAAHRRPWRWGRIRRAEQDTRIALEDVLAEALAAEPAIDLTPQQAATLLAAGIQVPIAAGAFLLAWLAQHPRAVDPTSAVWETLRLSPPTWLTARVTTREVELGGTTVPEGQVVFVSPLLLGRLTTLVPGDAGTLDRFRPREVAGRDPPTRRLAAVRSGTSRVPGTQPRDGDPGGSRRMGGEARIAVERRCTHRPESGHLAPTVSVHRHPSIGAVPVIVHPALQDTSAPGPASSRGGRSRDLDHVGRHQHGRGNRPRCTPPSDLRPRRGDRVRTHAAAARGSERLEGIGWPRLDPRMDYRRVELVSPAATRRRPRGGAHHALVVRARTIRGNCRHARPSTPAARRRPGSRGTRPCRSTRSHCLITSVERRDVRQPGGRQWGGGAWPDQLVADFKLLHAAIVARLTLEQSRRSLAEAIEAGAEAQLATQQLFGAVGHELRTPLSAILGYTEGLLDDAEHGSADDVTSGMKRDGPVVVRACERLLTIVDSLLGAGRAMSTDDQRQEIPLADAVADVIHWHRTPARTAGVDMQAVVDPSLTAWGHPSAVRQVLANLLGNAIAHHHPTGGTVHLTAEALVGESAKPMVRIVVRDDGPGLTPEQLQHAFEPFVRFAAPTTQGSGLGLSLSRTIAEREGGAVRGESTPGTGSSFWLELPAYVPRRD